MSAVILYFEATLIILQLCHSICFVTFMVYKSTLMPDEDQLTEKCLAYQEISSKKSNKFPNPK